MTTICLRSGWIAADSAGTSEGGGDGSGDWLSSCEKLYRIKAKRFDLGKCVVALSGESSPGLAFLEWLKGKRSTVDLSSSKFGALVLTSDGAFEFDGYLTPDPITDPFYAVGTGAKAGMAAMHAGASARRAVEIACLLDPYSRPPVVAWQL
jgi:hypothetical protein